MTLGIHHGHGVVLRARHRVLLMRLRRPSRDRRHRRSHLHLHRSRHDHRRGVLPDRAIGILHRGVHRVRRPGRLDHLVLHRAFLYDVKCVKWICDDCIRTDAWSDRS